MIFVKKAYALSGLDFGVRPILGFIVDVQFIFIFLFNFFVYLGWIGVVFGVAYAVFQIIFQLYSGSDASEDYEKFSGGLKKAILVVIGGIFLLSAGFIVKVVGTFFGVPDLKFDFWINR